ncbi:hypothetical protein Tco_1089238 [Tanacetum coccineum]
MANTTLVVTTVTKTATREKTLKEADAVPKASILDFYEEHYEDILPIIMDRAWHDKQKEVQTRLNFGENSKKIRRERENSSNSRAGNSPIRFHHERSKTRGQERHDDKNVFNRLSHSRKSVHERLSDTYSPSITKYGPSRASSRDSSDSRGRSLSRDRPRVKTASLASKNHMTILTPLMGPEPSIEIDLVTKITPAARRDGGKANPYFLVGQKAAPATDNTPGHAKRDLEDHVKNFQAAAQVERWAMPTWCHIFNSAIIGTARVWFDELPPESIDGYKDLKAAFLAYFMQQKKYVKDLV